jgi:hypothetical protein
MFLVLADGCQLTPLILKGKHPQKEKLSSRVILEVMRRRLTAEWQREDLPHVSALSRPSSG